jgi:hypothetical protein
MKTLKNFNDFTNLNEMLSNESYQIFESETLLNIQYHIINTDKDIDEMIECNENGLFGCSHAEFIECWSDFLDTLEVWESKYNTKDEKNSFDISKQVYNRIKKQIEDCEKYHIDHFSINDII